jgi:hypothetical protein
MNSEAVYWIVSNSMYMKLITLGHSWASAFRYPVSQSGYRIPEHSGPGLGPLIPVPDLFRHRNFCPFWYRTDRMPDSPQLRHLKTLYKGEKVCRVRIAVFYHSLSNIATKRKEGRWRSRWRDENQRKGNWEEKILGIKKNYTKNKFGSKCYTNW